MLDEIYAVAAALCSMREGEETLLRLLCQAAEEALLRRETTLPEACRETFLCAAGCMAAAQQNAASHASADISARRRPLQAASAASHSVSSSPVGS